MSEFGNSNDRQAMRSQVEEMTASARKLSDNLENLQQRITQLTGKASSQDGTVMVEVSSKGELRDIKFRPDAMRRAGSLDQLAKVIISTTKEATAKVSKQTEDIMSDFLPEGISFQDIINGNVDTATLLNVNKDTRR